MQNTLDVLATKLCESLPFDFTLYEKDGICKKSSNECNYCKQSYNAKCFCNKKTYTPNQKLVPLF